MIVRLIHLACDLKTLGRENNLVDTSLDALAMAVKEIHPAHHSSEIHREALRKKEHDLHLS